MRLYDFRADGNDFYSGILLYEIATLQSKVHGYLARPESQNILKGIFSRLDEIRRQIRLPCRCRHDFLRFCSYLVQYIPDGLSQPQHLVIQKTATIVRYK